MNNLEDFRTKEIKGLTKLRLIAIAFIIVINIAVLGVFAYLFYNVYAERNMHENFISYVAPTLLRIQSLLAFVFLPLIVVIYYRFNFVIEELRDLNNEFLAMYQEYTQKQVRPFTNIPQYIISQKGLIINKNIKKIILDIDLVNKIDIKNLNLGKGVRKCVVKFYQNNTYAAKITYSRTYPPEVDFLKQHIRIIQRNVVINE